tara:strand:+ start:320 stop:1252 length:933 start_codon:yes stop_codon:yes gene_type:complete
MVHVTKKERVVGNIQSLCWSSRAFGTLMGAVTGGMAYTSMGAINLFRICAIVPFFTAIFIWKLPKIKIKSKNMNVFTKLYINLKEQKRLAFLLLMINIAPDYGQFYVYYLQQQLAYTPQDFAWLSVSGSLTFFLSTITFNRYLIEKPPSTIIFIGLLGTFICRLCQLFVIMDIFPYFFIVLLDGVAESFFGTLMLLPLIILVAKGCKEGVEGSLYAMMMSISNLSNILGNWFGSFVGYLFNINRNNFTNMAGFTILCSILEFAIPLYIILRNKTSVSDDLPDEKFDELDPTEEPYDPVVLQTSETANNFA